MDIFGIPLTWASLFIIGMFVAIVWSLFTIFDFLFGGPNPLEANTFARIEAAQNPANLIVAYQDHQRRRFRFRVFVVVCVLVVLVVFAPVQTAQIAIGLRDAAIAILGVVRESMAQFATLLRSS